MINSDISSAIGKTPLIRLNRLAQGLKATITIKTESRNPTGSVKDRTAYALIDDAEKSGRLKEGGIILEPTSGNTGIALASIGTARGYKVEIVMPESMSVERRQIISAVGGKLRLTPASEGMPGAIKAARNLLDEYPGRYYMPDQFSNQANPAIHVLTTAPEIELDFGGNVDAVVAGIGTGGTISGIGLYFKSIMKKNVQIIGVEPAKSPVISQTLRGEKIQPAPHGIQGLGAGFIPKTLDLSLIDRVFSVEDEEAMDYARRLMKEEGVFCGISGGAALAAAHKVASEDGMEGKNIVVIIPDSGERYLSTALFNK